MPELTELDPAAARDWIARWDRQQEVYLPDREERFTALIDAVEAAAGRPDPLVLDLGCGPGSLAVRLLARLPDGDRGRGRRRPGHAVPRPRRLRRRAGLRFLDVDLRAPGWESGLGLEAGRRSTRSCRRPRCTGCPRRNSATCTDAGGPAAAGRAVPRRRPPAARRDGEPGARAAGPGAGGAGGPAALPRRARRARGGLGAVVAGRRRRPGAGRGRRRARAAAVHHHGPEGTLSPRTPARSARPGSPRSARSGSAAATACCAPSGKSVRTFFCILRCQSPGKRWENPP